jgi:LPS-assembly lipoprotein
MMRALFIPLALLLSGGLSACGFSPMHGSAGATAPLANMVVQMEKGSDVVDNQAGFFLAQRLRDRIGVSSDAAPYTLNITPRYSRRRLGLTSGDVASRYDVSVTATWDLIDSKSGKSLEKGRTVSIVTFGAPEGPYGVITADNVGVEQSAKETADKVIVQIARYFAEENKKP